MRIIRSIKAMSKAARDVRLRGRTAGFVPTMGAFHQGHLSLIRRCRRENDITVVSIFVNPLQFGQGEDFNRYPRPLRRDAGLCRREGVDILFCPQAKEMYPQGYKTYVELEDLSNILCGAFRPGHFQGVATVVAKLFNIVAADTAYFGQKDAQQAIIIKRMAADLNFSTRIKVLPTVREKDGLALSSRNIYLSRQERKDALVLPEALRLGANLIKSGLRDTAKIINRISALIRKKAAVKIDYIAITHPGTLEPLKKIRGACLIALAVRIGKTRLIDNIIVKFK